MKIFTQSVYILCRNREVLCSSFWTYFLCFSKCVSAPRCISMFLKERATASERYQSMCGCFWTIKRKNVRLLLKENVQHTVLLYVEDCVAASRNISMFFYERAAASEKISLFFRSRFFPFLWISVCLLLGTTFSYWNHFSYHFISKRFSCLLLLEIDDLKLIHSWKLSCVFITVAQVANNTY